MLIYIVHPAFKVKGFRFIVSIWLPAGWWIASIWTDRLCFCWF